MCSDTYQHSNQIFDCKFKFFPSSKSANNILIVYILHFLTLKCVLPVMSDFYLHSSGLDCAKWFHGPHSRPLKPFDRQVDCLYVQRLGSSAAPHYGESILPFIHPNLLSHMPHGVLSIGSCLLSPFSIVCGLKCINAFSSFT